MRRINYRFVITAVLLTASYFHTIAWMQDRWSARGSYYSHGFLVPLISLFLIYRKRDVLAGIPRRECTFGLYIFILGVLVQAISSFWRVHFTSGFSFLITASGIILYLKGTEYFKEIRFPLFFLIFMIPLPLIVIGGLSLKLKLLTTKITVYMTGIFGMPVVNKGNILYFPTGEMVVGDICSGLRSLISLLAMGALYAYIFPGERIKKLLLFALSVPAAVISNIARMFILCVIADIWGVRYAGGIVHDTTGILIYITAFILFFSAGRILPGRKI